LKPILDTDFEYLLKPLKTETENRIEKKPIPISKTEIIVGKNIYGLKPC